MWKLVKMLRFWIVLAVDNFDFTRKKFGWKTRENVEDLHFLVVATLISRENCKVLSKLSFWKKNDFWKSVTPTSTIRWCQMRRIMMMISVARSTLHMRYVCFKDCACACAVAKSGHALWWRACLVHICTLSLSLPIGPASRSGESSPLPFRRPASKISSAERSSSRAAEAVSD